MKKMVVTVPAENTGRMHRGWETAGVVFVADALGAWLVGLLADASRKKLTALVLGSDQERALRQAATAAVQDTADELSPSGGERAGQLAMVISEVFGEPMPDARLAGLGTLLEGLQAGIAGQLAVLDDVGLTGVGQSSADVLGVPGTVLAERLTGHLVREIMLRGSRGGPLTPLAGQLNHDLTHLQGQRVEGILARLADEIRDALGRPVGGAVAAGWPLGAVTDPFALEVHRPVQPDGLQHDLPALPVYVPRENDAELDRVVAAAAAGSSRIAVLVGGSSTGKTRACWEALRLLRDQKPGWRLWHPIDPSRPDAALAGLRAIGPRTVVWLNEAQFYLDVADGALGEQIAAGLRELLRNRARAPVLVLATMWPSFWDALTTFPAGGPDPHAQARELLNGQDITVPGAFTPAQLRRLSQATDVRLILAATGAQEGQVIQFLAGTPELLARYRNAPPAAAALIHAAMDARRLGMGIGLPKAFLEVAAPGYLTDAEWDALDGDWLEQALAYTAVDCRGVRGPLTRMRPRPDRSGAAGPRSRESDEQLAGRQAGVVAGPLYRLADYLDQHGRYHRKSQFPPAGFWAAAADHAFPGDQAVLGDAAHVRGLYRAAAQLHKNAAARGNPRAVLYLSNAPPYLRADDRSVHWAIAHATLDDPAAVAGLLDSLRAAGGQEQVTALLRRDPAAHVPVDHHHAVARLLNRLQAAGAQEQVTALADRAAAHISLDDPDGVAELLDCLRAVGAQEQVTALLRRDPAAHACLDDLGSVAELLDRLRSAGAQEQVTALADRAAAHVSLDDPRAVAGLLDCLRSAGAQEQVTALLRRDPATHAALDDPAAVAGLLDSLRAAGAPEQVTALLRRDPAAHAALDDPAAVAGLRDSLRAAGAPEQVTALLRRAAAHISLHNPVALTWLLDSLRAAGAQEQVTALLRRAAAHVSLDDVRAVAWLLDRLREAGARKEVTVLADRAAAHISLDDPFDVTWLLERLWAVGAEEQVTVLADRAAAHVSLEDPRAVAGLLVRLLRAGAPGQAIALLCRDPAAHAPLDNPAAVAGLLGSLRALGVQEQVTALLRRDPAAHVSLDDPYGVAGLLGTLRAAGAEEQVTVLADRAAAHISLDDPYGVAGLLGRLRAAGAPEQVTALIDRLPGAGMFELFRDQEGHKQRFRFGREADGSPAKPWGWEDLD